MFGDYGRVHSRKNQKISRNKSEKIKKRFEVDISNKLQQHIAGSDNDTTKLSALSANGKEPDSVADLFSSDDRPSKRYKNTNTTIMEEPLDGTTEDINIKQGDGVADLFSDTSKANKDIEEEDEIYNNGKGMHQPRITYSGARQLFSQELSYSDSDSSIAAKHDIINTDTIIDDYGKGKPHNKPGGAEWTDEEINAEIDNIHGPSNKVPRPSSNVALGATFDSIAILKDRVNKKGQNNENKEETQEALNNNSTDIEKADVNNEYRDEQEQAEQARREQEFQQRIEAIREQEKNKLDQLQQKLQDEFDDRMKTAKQEIEYETDERLRKELALSLRPEIKRQCRSEMEQEYDKKLNEKLNERFDNELRMKLKQRSNELETSFNSKIRKLKDEMDQRKQYLRMKW